MPQVPNYQAGSLSMVEFEKISHMKFKKATQIREGVYLLQKVELVQNLEALEEIYKLLLTGQVWVRQKNRDHYSGVGVEDRKIDKIVKEKVIDGKSVQVDDKHKVRNFTDQEYEEIKKSIREAIATLEQTKRNERPSSKESVKGKESRPTEISQKPTVSADRTYSEIEIKNLKNKMKTQIEHQVSQKKAQTEKKRKQHQEEVKEEKDRINRENIKEDQLKWDIKQSEIKSENK